MKRLATLVMAILLITGCNAMQPNKGDAELLWAETEKNIQKWVAPVKTEASPAEKPRIIPEPMMEIPQKTPELPEEPISQPLTATPSSEPSLPEQEGTIQSEQATPPQTEQTAENRTMSDWPYPRITCPPEPEWPLITCPPEQPTSTPEWPYITAPEPPTSAPEPEPTEPPQEEPTPTPVLNVPADPIPEPAEQPATPMPEPTAEPAQTAYAECSCGARLTPDELVPHMKAPALNGESHSYRAY